MITLTSALEAQLVEALASAFTPEDLEKRVMDGLRVPAAGRSGARDFRERVRELVRWAWHAERLDALIRTAFEANPHNPRLRAIAEAAGIAPVTHAILEQIIGASPFVDAAAWTRGLVEVQRQVCRIDVDGLGVGTGFLVGPDQVLTDFRLFAGAPAVDEIAAALVKTRVVFDAVSAETPTTTYRIAQPGVAFASERGPIVLRLDRQSAGSGTRARGWIALQPPPPLVAESPIAVVQYTGGTLRIGFDANGIIELRPDGTLVHRAPTDKGSMGAPYFDGALSLIGMHTGIQDPGWSNRGISTTAILEELNKAGLAWSASSGVIHMHTAGAMPPDRGRGELDDIVRSADVTIGADDDDVFVASDGTASAEDRWAWAEAAAVVATFDADGLQPSQVATPAGRVALLLESRAVAAGDRRRWVLPERIRVPALKRLAARGDLARVRVANASAVPEASDALDATLGTLLAGVQPSADELRDPDRLRALIEVTGWLAGVVAPLPSRVELRAALERATLIAPFRHLTRGFFAGRDEELTRLRAYVDAPDGAQGAPILIHGPGGMGKSALLAHFTLAYSERDPSNAATWRPFVYLDFDRPELDARDTDGIVLAIVRQLGPQVPAIAVRAAELVETWTKQRREQRARAPRGKIPSADDVRARMKGGLERFVQAAELLAQVPGPLLVVLDTLEEVQYATPDLVDTLASMVASLATKVPAMRPVLVGRLELGAGIEVQSIELKDLPPHAAEALLVSELPPEIAQHPGLVHRVCEAVRGNPLSLRLAAEVLKREQTALELFDDELQQRVGDAILQGRLYERILGHIHDAGVRALAYPGLVLRRITSEVIRYVLAGPCKLDVPDDGVARALFNQLAKEVALVGSTANDVLELRAELRRVVREDLARDPKSADERRAVHEAAVAYYAQRPGIADRAEEIYHRLALDQDPLEVDKRWLTGCEAYLQTAVTELAERGRAYLANRVGIVLDAQQVQTASQLEWEEWAYKRASDLLAFGMPQKALDVLAGRVNRLATSKLHVVESVARRSLQQPDLAGAEAAARAAIPAARASADGNAVRRALDELVVVRRLRGDTAGVLRALADLDDLGAALGDDLVVLEANVGVLESLGANAGEKFTDAAIKVFGRLPDQLLARAPELARRVAAQVGADDPDILQRVIRVVGTGSLDDAATAGLAGVLQSWKEHSPDIGSFVPQAMASAHELASAVQYLVANRSIHGDTARELADWLKSAVAPKPPRDGG